MESNQNFVILKKKNMKNFKFLYCILIFRFNNVLKIY